MQENIIKNLHTNVKNISETKSKIILNISKMSPLLIIPKYTSILLQQHTSHDHQFGTFAITPLWFPFLLEYGHFEH